MLHEFIDFILHINDHLAVMVQEYGTAIYAILFLIIFIETGLVIMPFLPGDSLLFAAGALCANEATGMDLFLMMALLIIAAILGDNTNYSIGKHFGMRATRFSIAGRKLVKQEHLDQTHAFFEKHGVKAIIMARFVPIVRTFTPFVAGMGKMSYRSKFLPYNIVGGILWIVSMSVSGYFFGQIPWVKENFEAVVLMIILLSLMPIIIAAIQARFKSKT